MSAEYPEGITDELLDSLAETWRCNETLPQEILKHCPTVDHLFNRRRWVREMQTLEMVCDDEDEASRIIAEAARFIRRWRKELLRRRPDVRIRP